MKRERHLNPAQSHYVLGRLINDGKVSDRDIERYLASMSGEIRALEEKLLQLRALATGGAPARRGRRRAGARAAAAPKPAKAARKKVVLTPEQKASRQLQGTYMSMLRQFPKARRTALQAIAKAKGREAAVEQMKADLAKKK